MRILIQRIDLLFTGLTSLSVALSLAIDNGIMDGLPHRPSGMETASVEASQLGTQPYWSVDALVNGQNVTLMVDTGSSDFWLQGPKAPSANGFSPGAPIMKSNGQDQRFDIVYGISPNAQTLGPVVATNVSLGSLGVKQFGVGVATQVAFPYPLDGFLGLAFKGRNSVSPTQQPTFMEAAVPSLRQPIFTTTLKTDSLGTLTFGYTDRSLYKGTFITARVNASRSSWVVDTITLSTSNGNTNATQSMQFDTGSGDTMYAEPTFVNDFWSQVQNSNVNQDIGLWTVPCNASIPDLHVSVKHSRRFHDIQGASLVAEPVQGPNVTGMCRGALQGSPPEYHNAGAPFFRAFHVVFNQLTPSISFAPQA